MPKARLIRSRSQWLPRRGIDWTAASAQLRSADLDEKADDLIDELSEAVFAGNHETAAAPCLTEAVRCARSDLSLRSAALALAVVAPNDDAAAIDALVDLCRRMANHPFVAPALLEALGLLALRSPLAHAQLSALLLRLGPSDSRYVLIKAAQVIGRLDAIRPDLDLRAKLNEFLTAEDMAVQAEARQQIALAQLADALLANDRSALRDRLAGARAAFARAHLSEEHRPDAATFVRLLDMLMTFLELYHDRTATAERLKQLANTFIQDFGRLGAYDQLGYWSDQTTLQAQHVLHIADALCRAADAAGTADEWVNFAAALEELAKLYALIRGVSASGLENERMATALGSIADVVFATALGPLLAQVVQQRRLSRIISDYVLTHGEDEITEGLRALEQAAATASFATGPPISERINEQIIQLAVKIGLPPDLALKEMLEAIQQGRVARWVEQSGIGLCSLPIERPDIYGGDPAVDEVVRPLLHQIAERIGNYPLAKWTRLVDVLVSLVKFTQYARDRSPVYVLCEADGGKGQRASETDLQENLFEWLRQSFGRAAVYEFARTGGGRPDTDVLFPEARFPVEAKHEFRSIEPEHVRTNFVSQSDAYAAASDRVSFLMLLDLRASNADGHRDRAVSARTSAKVRLPHSLYHLKDSFRVESLPADFDLPDAVGNIVVIGIVPGNRPLPSSMSTYSKRPATARRQPDTANLRQ